MSRRTTLALAMAVALVSYGGMDQVMGLGVGASLSGQVPVCREPRLRQPVTTSSPLRALTRKECDCSQSSPVLFQEVAVIQPELVPAVVFSQ